MARFLHYLFKQEGVVMDVLENLFKQLDDINNYYEERMDKLRERQERDAQLIWQRISLIKKNRKVS